MLTERKLTERELGKREEAIKGLMSNKRKLVQKYGKDAEKVMYGIATKQAKNKVESMNKEKIRELVKQSLLKKEGFVNTTPLGEPESGQEVDVDTGFSGRADYGAEDKYLGGEDEIEQASANTPPSGGQKFLPGVPTPQLENITSKLTDDQKKELKYHLSQFKMGNIDKDDILNVLDQFGLSENVEIPTNVMNKINAGVKTAQTAAGAMIDFYNQMSEKENIDFTKNPKFRVAIERLRDLAKDVPVKSKMEEIDSLLEKLTKKSKVDDFVDDFKKSDAKQFKGKSAEKKRKMAVAAYLAKRND